MFAGRPTNLRRVSREHEPGQILRQPCRLSPVLDRLRGSSRDASARQAFGRRMEMPRATRRTIASSGLGSLPRAGALALATAITVCAPLVGLNLSAGSISPPLAEAAPPAPGLHVETWTGKAMATEAERDDEIQRLRSSGARWVRVIALWSALETGGKGRWREDAFDRLDQQLERLQAAGLNVVLVAGPGTPFWASSDPEKYEHNAAGNTTWVNYRPERLEDYADFTRELARRVKPRGVKAFQLWNEPDHKRGRWLPGPDAGEYAGLLKLAYPAIKSVDESATVLVGGLINNNHAFLQGIYDAGGGPFFDGVANHVYPQYPPRTCAYSSDGKPSRHALCGLSRLRETLTANGDAKKRTWITELSWSSCRCHYQDPVSEEGQALYLRQAYSLLAKRWDVPVALWFRLRDPGVPGVARTGVQSGFGLTRSDNSAKPAFATFQNYAVNRNPKMTISRPVRLRVAKRTLLAFSGRSALPMRLEAFAAPKATPCAATASEQASQPGSHRLLRPRTVSPGAFSRSVPLTPSRAVGKRACGYLTNASASVPDATADTLMPLPTPPGERCRSLIVANYRSSVAGIVVEGPTCARASASLSRWADQGFEPQSGPSGYTCAISRPDDANRRAYECRRAGTAKLSFLVRRPRPGT